MESQANMGYSAEEEKYSTIYLIRHGETPLNKQNKLRGWNDIPLNETGEKQAEDMSKAMEHIKLDKIYASNLQRTRQTAEPLIKNNKKASTTHTGYLRPINFGDWNGQPLDEIGPKMEDLHSKWMDDSSLTAPNGESFESYQKRQVTVFEYILKNIGDKKENIGIVAHLRNCIWIISYIMNDRQPLKGQELDMLNKVTQDPSNISILQFDKEKNEVKIKSINTKEI